MLTTPQWVLLASLFIPMLTLVGIVWIWGRIRSFRSERSPITDKLVRSPGESLRREFEKMDEQINDMFVWAFFSPAIAPAFLVVAQPAAKPGSQTDQGVGPPGFDRDDVLPGGPCFIWAPAALQKWGRGAVTETSLPKGLGEDYGELNRGKIESHPGNPG